MHERLHPINYCSYVYVPGIVIASVELVPHLAALDVCAAAGRVRLRSLQARDNRHTTSVSYRGGPSLTTARCR